MALRRRNNIEVTHWQLQLRGFIDVRQVSTLREARYVVVDMAVLLQCAVLALHARLVFFLYTDVELLGNLFLLRRRLRIDFGAHLAHFVAQLLVLPCQVRNAEVATVHHFSESEYLEPEALDGGILKLCVRLKAI